MDADEEQIMLRQCQNREEIGFRKLYQLFHVRIYHLALGFFPVDEDALDATQEIFLRVFSSISSYRSESQLHTWIYAVALNYCKMEKRRQNSARRFAFFEKLISSEKYTKSELVHWEHPGISYENKERATRLLKAIHQLSPAQRDAVLLLRYEELSYKEASVIMNVSVSALESLISRAMANLRKILKE